LGWVRLLGGGSTVVCGSGAVGTDARIHTKLRVAAVSLDEVQVTDEFGGETFRRFAWHPGELAVADRAHFTAAGIQHVLDAGADVLVRYLSHPFRTRLAWSH